VYRLLKIILGCLYLFTFTSITPSTGSTNTQTSPSIPKSDISDDRKRIMIMSYINRELTDDAIEDEVTDVVIDIAFELDRFEIFTQYDVWNLRGEEKIRSKLVDDSTIIDLKELLNCQEAIIVKILHFSQIGVPPEENQNEEEERNFIERMIDGIFSGNSDDYSDNIQTRLSVRIENMDIESGESLQEFDISVSHTGGTYAESREKTIRKFRKVSINKIKRLYQLNSEVIAVEGTKIDLYLGSNIGITDKTLFEILQPDSEKSVSGAQVTIPGKSAGLVCVKSLGNDRNRSQIIRQWLPIGPGYHAVEYAKYIYAVQVFFQPRFPEDHLSVGIQYHFKPLDSFDYGLNLRYNQITDSYDEIDHGFGLGAFSGKRILTMPSMLMHAKVGLEVDFPFKTDDEGHRVAAPVFSGTLGFNASLMLTQRTDFELNIGYRFSIRSSNWTYSEDEESYDAIWYDTAPVVDLNGFFFTLGYKFIFL
jgi:hypothetical protein